MKKKKEQLRACNQESPEAGELPRGPAVAVNTDSRLTVR
jgi:hypothetical protein